MIVQKQPYRFTNCRCIIENYWDIIILMIFIGFAMYGLLMLIYKIRKYKKNG